MSKPKGPARETVIRELLVAVADARHKTSGIDIGYVEEVRSGLQLAEEMYVIAKQREVMGGLEKPLIDGIMNYTGEKYRAALKQHLQAASQTNEPASDSVVDVIVHAVDAVVVERSKGQATPLPPGQPAAGNARPGRSV